MKLSISVLGFSLSVVSLVGLNGCDRQGPPPKAVKEPSQVLDTAVGGTAKRAMHKAKEVETALGGADNRTAEVSKEGTSYVRDLERMGMAGEFFTACHDSIGAIEELYLYVEHPAVR